MTQSSPSESTDRLDRIERSLEALTGQVSRIPEIEQTLETLTGQVSRIPEIEQTLEALTGQVSRIPEIEQTLETLTGQVSRVPEIDRKLESLTEQVSRVSEDVDKLRVDLATESKKWDERFFQLSRDTLNFSRNVIVTAGIVAVLVPALREAIVVLVQTFKQQ